MDLKPSRPLALPCRPTQAVLLTGRMHPHDVHYWQQLAVRATIYFTT
jgi:hypothetical protein